MKAINNFICHLAECPVWNPEDKALYWTDILNGKLWKYSEVDKKVTLIWEGNHLIGGFAFTSENNIVFCSDKGVFLLKRNDDNAFKQKFEQLYSIPMSSDERFNDITTDPEGRIYAGTKKVNNKNGTLWLLEKGKDPKSVIKGTKVSNGMTFSLDQNFFFHTDSPDRIIRKYRYDRDTGNITEPQTFFQGTDNDGFPDGITLDGEDHIWVAFWGASCIRRLDPEGNIVREIKIPALQPSSVMFGGEKLDTLFITTACEGGVDMVNGFDKNGNFLGGLVYKIKVDVCGRKEWKTDL
jgi:D-xylono/L-arabinono-1,4-lactonase